MSCGCSGNTKEAALASAPARRRGAGRPSTLAALRQARGAAQGDMAADPEIPPLVGLGGAGDLGDFFEWDSLQGEALTQALAVSGYSDDKQGLRRYYRNNKAVIDAYLGFVDTGAVVKTLASETEAQDVGLDLQQLGAGVAGGVGLTLLMSKFL
jgi:hypothetical protein